MNKLTMLAKGILGIVAITAVVGACLVVRARMNANEPNQIRQIVSTVDTTHVLSAENWNTVKDALDSSDPLKQEAGLQVAQSTLVPIQMAYATKRAYALLQSPDPMVRSAALITLWKLRAPDALTLVAQASKYDTDADVRELMRAVLIKAKRAS